MPITQAPLPIQFSGGVESRQEAKQVPTTRLLDLQNCVFTKSTSLSKRNGYRALSRAIQRGGGAVTAARGMGSRGRELLLFTDRNALSYRPSSDEWSDTGEVAATVATTLPVARTGSYQTNPDVAERNGVRVVAWEDSRGGVWCEVLESATGRVLLPQTQVDSDTDARDPRCVPSGDSLLVLWTRFDISSINVAVISTASPSAAPAVKLLTGDLAAGNPSFDADSAPGGPSIPFSFLRPAVMAWARTGGGFRIGFIDSGGNLGSPLAGFPAVATFTDPPSVVIGSMSIAWDPQELIVAVLWSSTATLQCLFLTGSTFATVRFASSVSGFIADRLTCTWGAVDETDTPVLFWASEQFAARSDIGTVRSGQVRVLNSSTDAASTSLLGHNLVSRAFHDGSVLAPVTGGDDTELTNGDAYVMIAHTVAFFPYVACLRLSSASIAAPGATIVSRLLPGECAGSNMRTTAPGVRAWCRGLPSVMHQSLADGDAYSRRHGVVVPYRIQLSSQNGDQFSEQGLKLCTIDFDVPHQTAELGRGLYLASSAPMHYDGDAWHEADFHTAPDQGFDTAGAPVGMAANITPIAGGSIANGTYLYAFWYEAVDAQGELHRGAVSVKILATMTGGPRSFTMTIPTCRLSRFANVRICVARSTQGATGTDSTLPMFKVTSNDVTITTGANRFITNNPFVHTETFFDSLSDAQLITREPLYTNGGILSNAPAPWSGAFIASGKGRLFWGDTTDPNMVRFSQVIKDDVSLEAPVDLSLRKDPFGGSISALGILDDTVILFGETAIYVFGGAGPADSPDIAPEVNAFSSPELVTSDVGCIVPVSVGQTPAGLIFKSQKGIQLLTRQRQVVYIGAPMELYNEQDVRRCTLLPDRQQIVLLTSSGRTMLWDYARDQWSTFTNHEGLDAAVVDGTYHYLRTDSRVFAETPGVYKDDTTRIRMLIETAWIHFADYLQGWQRILYAYFLGTRLSAHTLLVRFRIDYNDEYGSPISSDVDANWNPSAYGAGPYGAGLYGANIGGPTRYQRRIHINKRCQAIAFRIEDEEAFDDFGASFELSELLLIGGGIGPDFKVGAARSA